MNKEYIINKKHIVIGYFIKALAIISCIYGLCVGLTEPKDMTYFTNLSNILIALMLLLSLVFDIVIHKSNGTKNPKNNFFFIMKFVFTLCITITFLIYMIILAPTSDLGFFASYMNNHCGSLCLHFITPVLAIIDFVFLDYNYKSSPVHSIYAIIPPLVYVGIIVILATTGMRWGSMSAPYNFLNYGAPTGWFGFDLSQMNSTSLGIGVAYMIVGLVIIFLLIGLLLLLFNKISYKHSIKKFAA